MTSERSVPCPSCDGTGVFAPHPDDQEPGADYTCRSCIGSGRAPDQLTCDHKVISHAGCGVCWAEHIELPCPSCGRDLSAFAIPGDSRWCDCETHLVVAENPWRLERAPMEATMEARGWRLVGDRWELTIVTTTKDIRAVSHNTTTISVLNELVAIEYERGHLHELLIELRS